MDSGFFEKAKRFFFPREEVYKHWYVPLDNFQFAADDFYQMIEKELSARKVPGLEISRVQISEGGLLSAKREYLRLKRERLLFDICAAPFGTSYFFSFRAVELPIGMNPLSVILVAFGVMLTYVLLVALVGYILGFVVLVALLAANIWFLRNAVALGFKDLDAALLNTPVVAPLYEMFFRKETYYREDTRLMYLSTVDYITKALVDEVTAAKGIKLVRRFERGPILGDLYHERTSAPKESSPPEAEPN